MSVTASGLDRAALCAASEALPKARRSGVYANRGTAIHKFLQLVQEGASVEDALSQIDAEWREVCACIDVDGLPDPGTAAAEVSFAYNVVTGEARELGRGTDRDYSSVTEDEIAGQVDLVAVAGAVVRVSDYKSGHNIPSAYGSRQLKLYSLCALKVYGATRAIADIVVTRPDEEARYESAEFDAFDLEAVFAMELRDIHERIRQAKALYDAKGADALSVVEGEHCRYCASAHVCPAKVSLARELGALAVQDDGITVRGVVGELTAANAAEAYRRAKAVIGLGHMIIDRVEELARSRPIQLSPGMYLGAVTGPGNEELDPDGVFEVLEQLYGADIAELGAPAQRKATKTGTLKAAARALKSQGAAKSIAAAEREAIAALRAAGYATKPIVTRIKTYEGPECITDRCVEQALAPGATCSHCAVEAECQELSQ